ncbi:uncharacterized protein PRCAT00002516001 [Priceomyces carsonii]|uniref:uncharacterized protein n=1 Tax=Priceomyces carsonii TaxID=28549 RepID=UPI002ED7A699|nr:unnamed protein product [Priceomyces carsonii]
MLVLSLADITFDDDIVFVKSATCDIFGNVDVLKLGICIRIVIISKGLVPKIVLETVLETCVVYPFNK